MSILIKDMEMPETCEECSFHCYHSDGEYVCVATPLFYPMNLANSKGIRKDWCPLVEVPTPHGRLIDADALDYKLGASDRDIYVRCTLEEDAPTVIEAEEGEDE